MQPLCPGTLDLMARGLAWQAANRMAQFHPRRYSRPSLVADAGYKTNSFMLHPAGLSSGTERQGLRIRLEQDESIRESESAATTMWNTMWKSTHDPIPGRFVTGECTNARDADDATKTSNDNCGGRADLSYR